MDSSAHCLEDVGRTLAGAISPDRRFDGDRGRLVARLDLIEFSLFALGVWIYTRMTRPLDRVGVWSFWSLVALLVLSYFGNVFGGAPPGETEVAVVSLGIWLFVPWGYWIDRRRVLEAQAAAAVPGS